MRASANWTMDVALKILTSVKESGPCTSFWWDRCWFGLKGEGQYDGGEESEGEVSLTVSIPNHHRSVWLWP